MKRVTKTLVVTCSRCGAKSRPVRFTSPAAPMLSALEELHREEGWAYQVGFFSMLTGDHHPVCPACVKTAKATIAIKCEDDSPAYDQQIRTIVVTREDDFAWYGRHPGEPESASEITWPKCAWKRVST